MFLKRYDKCFKVFYILNGCINIRIFVCYNYILKVYKIELIIYIWVFCRNFIYNLEEKYFFLYVIRCILVFFLLMNNYKYIV